LGGATRGEEPPDRAHTQPPHGRDDPPERGRIEPLLPESRGLECFAHRAPPLDGARDPRHVPVGEAQRPQRSRRLGVRQVEKNRRYAQRAPFVVARTVPRLGQLVDRGEGQR
jgi:hypothetical protein